MSDVQLNDIGTVIEITLTEDDVVIDVSSASVKEIDLLKVDGTPSTKTAVFTSDGTDGKIQYVTVDGDFDTVGLWRVQGRIVMGGADLHSAVGEFNVLENI